jgi:hypothetical protein
MTEQEAEERARMILTGDGVVPLAAAAAYLALDAELELRAAARRRAAGAAA